MTILLIVIIGLAAVAAVLLPILRPQHEARAGSAQTPLDDAAIESRVEAYRQALRTGTLCLRCGFANAEGSLFCAECGERLVAAMVSARSDAGT
jgi:hypothetical protein